MASAQRGVQWMLAMQNDDGGWATYEKQRGGTWLEALIRTGALSAIDARFIASDRRRVPILFSRTAITDSEGNMTDIICVAKDMTGYVRELDEGDQAAMTSEIAQTERV